MYEEKPTYLIIPYSLNTGTPGGKHVNDYHFTDLEWRMAQEIQAVTISSRHSSWSRLIAARRTIVEEATSGVLETAARFKDEIVLRPLIADFWAVAKIEQVFEYCTIPGRLGVVSNQPPIFVSRLGVERVFGEIEATAKRRLAGEHDAAQDRDEVATRVDQNLLPEQKKVPAEAGHEHAQVGPPEPTFRPSIMPVRKLEAKAWYIQRVKSWPSDTRPP